MQEASERLGYTDDRELSWLKFNRRILEMAADETVPLLERLRFLSIFTSNLDEFFMVRVGRLMDLQLIAPYQVENKRGRTPAQQLELILAAVPPLIARRDALYQTLTRLLEEQGVRDWTYEALAEEEKTFCKQYYRENVRPLLSPQIIDPSHPFPFLRSKSLYVAVLLRQKSKRLLGMVGVPESVPSILFLPGRTGEFLRAETLLLAHLKKIFAPYPVEEAAVIAVTRNANLPYDGDDDREEAEDVRRTMARLLKLRDRLKPIRLEIQGQALHLEALLRDRLGLKTEQCFASACPLKLGYAFVLDRCDPALYYPPCRPVYPLNPKCSIWEQVTRGDVLLCYPYHAMQPFLDLLKQAASDPKVLSIQMTLYRLANRSAVVKALCQAAENGKAVTVLVELRARFDEKNNLTWAGELEEAGCQVIYGPEGYKCHGKLCLITRKAKNGLAYLTQVGTGNYNEKTATQYTDFSLLTARREIGEDGVRFFQNMLLGNLYGEYQTLLVAPIAMKARLMRLIDGEIRKGEQGRIVIKTNAVTDRALIDKLAEASQAGVRVDLIVRGICCLIPGIPEKTDHITVTSIVGRFLEHARVYAFGRENPRVYLSSADLMTRNQDRRVEIACPVQRDSLRRWLVAYLALALRDNQNAWRQLPDGNYFHFYPKNLKSLSSQQIWVDHPPRPGGAAPLPEDTSVLHRLAEWLRRKWEQLRRAFCR